MTPTMRGQRTAPAAHDHVPVRQLVHRPAGGPAAPVEEFALLIRRLFPQAGRIIEYAAVEREVLAAGND